MAEDDGARVLCLEPCEQACHGRALCRCAVVGGVSAAVDAAGVGYVDGVAVVSLDAVGDAPLVEQPVRRACGVDDIVVARVAPSVPSESRHDALDCLAAVSCGAVHDEHGDGALVCGVSLCHGVFFRFVMSGQELRMCVRAWRAPPRCVRVRGVPSCVGVCQMCGRTSTRLYWKALASSLSLRAGRKVTRALLMLAAVNSSAVSVPVLDRPTAKVPRSPSVTDSLRRSACSMQ